MGKTQLRPHQVGGVNNATIEEDILDIVSKIRSFNRPVPVYEELPQEGNLDGDVRLVLSNDKFYVWDQGTGMWITDIDHMTVATTKRIVIETNKQKNFTTNLPVGSVDGIANVGTILLLLNGISQHKDVDYSLGMSGQDPPRLLVSWVSEDFDLDTDDVLQVNYDKLVIM